jgi:Aerotolerance regulator N-terminal
VFQVLWHAPATLFALAAIAAPLLIHILVQRRAERFPFPSLRFLQPTRLAAIRRHVLEDAALLAVRAAILAAAIVALAGPLIVTPQRRSAWSQRIVRAVVDDANEGLPRTPADAAAYLTREFTGSSLADTIRRAVAWLETSPPARRELAILSRFPIGSMTAADLAVIPASIGIRLERAGTLPAARTADGGKLLSADRTLARQVMLEGSRTSVRDSASTQESPWAIEIVNPPAMQPAIDSAVAAVLDRRVWAPLPDRRATLVVAPGADAQVPSGAGSIRTPWIADTVARLARDRDLQLAASRIGGALADARFAGAPWLTIAISSDGRPLLAAAEFANRLIVASGAPPADLVTPLLLRSLANAVGAVPDLQRNEVVPIADEQLRAWSRPAAPPDPPSASALRDDGDGDRRWLWLAALVLLATEAWMRTRAAAEEPREDPARVA